MADILFHTFFGGGAEKFQKVSFLLLLFIHIFFLTENGLILRVMCNPQNKFITGPILVVSAFNLWTLYNTSKGIVNNLSLRTNTSPTYNLWRMSSCFWCLALAIGTFERKDGVFYQTIQPTDFLWILNSASLPNILAFL